jgi:phosphoglycolate phosphatase-like HAD superfamily hydrolase
LVKSACAALDVPPDRVVMIGDIGSDLAAAEAAGVAGILVPTAATRPDEVTAAAAADRLQPSLPRAVAAVLGGRW